MEDHAVGVDRAADVHRVQQRRDRLLVDGVVGAAEVDEVEGVAEDPVDPGFDTPLLEQLEVRWIVVGRPPRARALREHLRLGANRLRAVDRRVNAAGGRDVGAEPHERSVRYPAARRTRATPRRRRPPWPGAAGADVRRRANEAAGEHEEPGERPEADPASMATADAAESTTAAVEAAGRSPPSDAIVKGFEAVAARTWRGAALGERPPRSPHRRAVRGRRTRGCARPAMRVRPRR